MTNEELHANFVYEADTGMLRRLGGRKLYPWRKSGSRNSYLATTFGGKTYLLHRLVWQYHFGEVPPMLDHKDGDTRNCKIDNLRPCTPTQNQYNSAKKISNRAGAKGVVHHPRCKSRPWQAKIGVQGRVISLGYFQTVVDASAAYAAGALKYAAEFSRQN